MTEKFGAARAELVQSLRRSGIRNEAVLRALGEIPRHQFVPPGLADQAYRNCALPIERGQTISQPYVVARMTESALGGAESLHRVLEIGTGSGYQAAVLARVAAEVCSVERVKHLHRQAAGRFAALGMDNVRLRHGDGAEGWPERAPYDAILVTAAAPEVPSALLEQLTPGGRLVIPVNAVWSHQELQEITRGAKGEIRRKIDDVVFVPLLEGTVSA